MRGFQFNIEHSTFSPYFLLVWSFLHIGLYSPMQFGLTCTAKSKKMAPTALEGKVIEGHPYNNSSQKTDFNQLISGIVIGKNLVVQTVKQKGRRANSYIPMPAYLVQTSKNEIKTILALDTIQCLPNGKLHAERTSLKQIVHNLSRALPYMNGSISADDIHSCVKHLKKAIRCIE